MPILLFETQERCEARGVPVLHWLRHLPVLRSKHNEHP
jgi:hypothetical protein